MQTIRKRPFLVYRIRNGDFITQTIRGAERGEICSAEAYLLTEGRTYFQKTRLFAFLGLFCFGRGFIRRNDQTGENGREF